MADNETHPDPQPKRHRNLLDAVGLSRFIMILAVISILLGSAMLLLIGTYEIFAAIWHAFTDPGVEAINILRRHLIETVDTFLIAVVMYVIAIGLYQLFVNHDVTLPPWLRMRGVGDLEKRLLGMTVPVLAVVFVTHAIEPTPSEQLLPLGLAIGAVIAAIALFMYQEGRNEGREAGGKE